MKEIILSIVILLLAPVIASKGVSASDQIAMTSASLASDIPENQTLLDVRTKALKQVFAKYNSPLLEQAQYFVKYADEYGVDWKLLPAISGLESTFGKFLMPGSYNAYGWGGGRIYFESWEDGIRTINKSLRARYIDRGADNVWSIGPIYAESPTWAVRVNIFMEEIDQEFLNLSVFSVLPNI
jgi:hypothetical protein